GASRYGRVHVRIRSGTQLAVQAISPTLLGPGTVDLGGQRAAILICYEQLLTWPMLPSAAERPTILIAISNESWTAATTVPRIQHACVRAWARLFGIPVISAINS